MLATEARSKKKCTISKPKATSEPFRIVLQARWKVILPVSPVRFSAYFRRDATISSVVKWVRSKFGVVCIVKTSKWEVFAMNSFPIRDENVCDTKITHMKRACD